MIAGLIAMPTNLQLRGQRLVYSIERRLKQVQTEELLDRFIALSGGWMMPGDVLSFARRYGPLYLCDRHGIAAYHMPLLINHGVLGPAPISADEPFKYDWCGPRLDSRKPETLSEPIEVWFKLAKSASSLLTAANMVRLHGDAPPELVEQVDGFQGNFGQKFGKRWRYLDDPASDWLPISRNGLITADVHF